MKLKQKYLKFKIFEKYLKFKRIYTKFFSKTNDEITDFLVGYLTGKTNKQLLNNGGAVNDILKEDYSEIPSYKSNSEIIIISFKKDQGVFKR